MLSSPRPLPELGAVLGDEDDTIGAVVFASARPRGNRKLRGVSRASRRLRRLALWGVVMAARRESIARRAARACGVAVGPGRVGLRPEAERPCGRCWGWDCPAGVRVRIVRRLAEEEAEAGVGSALLARRWMGVLARVVAEGVVVGVVVVAVSGLVPPPAPRGRLSRAMVLYLVLLAGR